jgi:hypothetical protein
MCSHAVFVHQFWQFNTLSWLCTHSLSRASLPMHSSCSVQTLQCIPHALRKPHDAFPHAARKARVDFCQHMNLHDLAVSWAITIDHLIASCL